MMEFIGQALATMVEYILWALGRMLEYYFRWLLGPIVPNLPVFRQWAITKKPPESSVEKDIDNIYEEQSKKEEEEETLKAMKEDDRPILMLHLIIGITMIFVLLTFGIIWFLREKRKQFTSRDGKSSHQKPSASFSASLSAKRRDVSETPSG